ncbi:MAG TPA: hypothetical protein VFR15_13200, partial [Chloroflexia bacterium]|nr:hypothetical protein [Chloroflexia bacterium]
AIAPRSSGKASTMKFTPRSGRATTVLALLALVLALPASFASGQAQAQPRFSARYFPETGKVITGRFLDYWTANGGLAQQGFPISYEMTEVSDTDGKPYKVQYFERAVFEWHPEKQPPYDVLLSLLGAFSYAQKYPSGAPGQAPNTANAVTFPETGKTLGGRFRQYWERNGGLAQQGFPISDEFNEVSALDGKTYRVQYFERAVFEYHPENRPPHDVLLSQLGTFRYRAKYPLGAPLAQGVPQASPGCASHVTPGTWRGPLTVQLTAGSGGMTLVGNIAGTLESQVACDSTFKASLTVSTYAAEGRAGIARLLTCSAVEQPIADLNGVVTPMADGLHLVVLGGTWRQGATRCSGAVLASPQTQVLTGTPLDPADIKVDRISGDSMSGTAAFAAVPVERFMREQTESIRPGTPLTVTTTSRWEMTRVR